MICIIKKNTYGEFEVPTQTGLTGADQIYFADSKADALDTARFVHGVDVETKFVKGTYTIA
jgi:hypothetical protein